MTTHWLHVTAAWGGTLAVLGALVVGVVLRQRTAVATLKLLDPRA